MAQSKIATAYVQVMPSMDGVAPKVQSYFGGAGQSAGKSFGSSMGVAMKTGIAAGAAGLGLLLKESIGQGAGLQQSLGGIETLFGAGGKSIEEYATSVGKTVDEVSAEYTQLMAAQQAVFDNAENAYKTAGLSSNAYMEMVTSFSASLIASLGGDTQKAAQVADMALIDMSDNANKMGTDMQAIQDAYQGFAKQNYTMLDNLKLGYGGTKTEMERLLADAQKLTGVEYDIDNLADVYTAIHAIQEELGITGTTATEASSTVTGSFNAMKAAAQNVLGNLALGQPMEESLQALKETTDTFLTGNLMPMIGTILDGLPGLIEDGVGGMITWLGNPDNIAGVLGAMWDFGSAIIGAVWNGITSAMGTVYELWPGLFDPMTTNPDISMPGGAFPQLVVPGYATGLDYVPYDNFLARLHEGEMVLTRAQANAVRSGRVGGGVTVVQQIYSEAKTAADLMQEARYQQEMGLMFGV
jgi:hypothetical protein